MQKNKLVSIVLKTLLALALLSGTVYLGLQVANITPQSIEIDDSQVKAELSRTPIVSNNFYAPSAPIDTADQPNSDIQIFDPGLPPADKLAEKQIGNEAIKMSSDYKLKNSSSSEVKAPLKPLQQSSATSEEVTAIPMYSYVSDICGDYGESPVENRCCGSLVATNNICF